MYRCTVRCTAYNASVCTVYGACYTLHPFELSTVYCIENSENIASITKDVAYYSSSKYSLK